MYNDLQSSLNVEIEKSEEKRKSTIKIDLGMITKAKKTLKYFMCTMRKVIENERAVIEDCELVCAARESVKQYGTISWEDIKHELEHDRFRNPRKEI
jgi:hypothetical protein